MLACRWRFAIVTMKMKYNHTTKRSMLTFSELAHLHFPSLHSLQRFGISFSYKGNPIDIISSVFVKQLNT